MRGKVDENMPVEAADLLRTAGWDCDTVLEEELGGTKDPELARRCQAEGRVLVTLDTDVADIRAYPPGQYVGILVLRPVKPSRDSVLALVRQRIPVLKAEWGEHRLWIVEPGRVRVRGASPPAV